MSLVKQNDTVKIHYTGKFKSGEVFDSSVDRDPLEFTVGQGKLIPGLEKGVIDMKVNDTKTLNIQPSEAYGEVREDLKQEVSKDQLPPEIKPEVGMGLVSQTPDGREIQLVVDEVKEDSIIVDANHPLAGKELVFEVQLLEIK